MSKAFFPLALALLLASTVVHTCVKGQESVSQSEAQRITLFSSAKYRDQGYRKSSFNFQYGLRSDDEKWAQTARGYSHLDYGFTSINSDSDWFQVSMGDDDSSRIKDLGQFQWSDVYSTPFLPANPHTSTAIRMPLRGESFESSSDQRTTKAIAGHMYVVHVKTRRADLYVMFRVDELVPNDQCLLSWKLMPSPEK